MKRIITALLGAAAGCVMAQSGCYPYENRTGILSNVSSSGVATKENPVTVCTIVNALESVDSSTVFLSETETGDAVMDIFYPGAITNFPNVSGDPYNQNLFPVRKFDNFRDSVSPEDIDLLKTKLRLPARETDAAAIFSSDERFYGLLFIATAWTQSIYSYKFGVCAVGYPKEGSAKTAVSITNLGPSKKSVCYRRSGYFFEK